jgi:hypothetical protein
VASWVQNTAQGAGPESQNGFGGWRAGGVRPCDMSHVSIDKPYRRRIIGTVSSGAIAYAAHNERNIMKIKKSVEAVRQSVIVDATGKPFVLAGRNGEDVSALMAAAVTAAAKAAYAIDSMQSLVDAMVRATPEGSLKLVAATFRLNLQLQGGRGEDGKPIPVSKLPGNVRRQYLAATKAFSRATGGSADGKGSTDGAKAAPKIPMNPESLQAWALAGANRVRRTDKPSKFQNPGAVAAAFLALAKVAV